MPAKSSTALAALRREFNSEAMMKLIVTSVLMITCLFSQTAWAQCASGANAGGVCVPPPDQSYSPLNPSNQARQQPRAVWADRWGAVAYDPSSGDAGNIEGQESKSLAAQIAMTHCQRNGAKHCKVLLTFYNQCGAVAYGGREMAPANAPSNEQAEQLAMQSCGHDDCKIVYSACSFAQRIR
jgi:hypothetical protein